MKPLPKLDEPSKHLISLTLPPVGMSMNLARIVAEAKSLDLLTDNFKESVQSSSMAKTLAFLTETAPSNDDVRRADTERKKAVSLDNLRREVKDFCTAESVNELREAINSSQSYLSKKDFCEELRELLPMINFKLKHWCQTLNVKSSCVENNPSQNSDAYFTCMNICVLLFEVLYYSGGELICEQSLSNALDLFNAYCGVFFGEKNVGKDSKKRNQSGSVICDVMRSITSLRYQNVFNSYQINQLLDTAFQSEKISYPDLQNVATELIVSMFTRYPNCHEYLLSNITSLLPDIVFSDHSKITVQGGLQIYPFTLLVLRVLQSICIGDELGYDSQVRKYDMLKGCSFFLCEGFVRVLYDENKQTLDGLKRVVSDLCLSAGKVMWPSASSMIKSLSHVLANIITDPSSNGKKKKTDHREVCTSILAQISEYLFSEESMKTSWLVVPLTQEDDKLQKQYIELDKVTSCPACSSSSATDTGNNACKVCVLKTALESYYECKDTYLSDASTRFTDVRSLYSAMILGYIDGFSGSVDSITSERLVGLRKTMLCKLAEFWKPTEMSKGDEKPKNRKVSIRCLDRFFQFEYNRIHGIAPLITKAKDVEDLYRKVVYEDLSVCRRIATRCMGVLLSEKIQSTLRRVGVTLLDSVISGNPSLLKSKAVIQFTKNALMDKAPKVKQRILMMLHKLLSTHDIRVVDDVHSSAPIDMLLPIEEPSKSYFEGENSVEISASVIKIIQTEFLDIFSRLTADKSPLVRGQSVRILGSISLSTKASNLLVETICLKLSERLNVPTETPAIQSLVLDLYVRLLFGPEDKIFVLPTLLAVVGSKLHSTADGFKNVLERVYSHLKKTKGDDYAEKCIDSWMIVLLDLFPKFDKQKSEFMLKVLQTTHLFAKFQPSAITGYLKYLTHYLDQIPDSYISRAICVDVINILQVACPYLSPGESIQRWQAKLTPLISSDDTALIRAAVNALCLTVIHVTKDFDHLIEPVLCESLLELSSAIQDSDCGLDDSRVLRLQRYCFLLGCLAENLDFVNHVDYDELEKNNLISFKNVTVCLKLRKYGDEHSLPDVIYSLLCSLFLQFPNDQIRPFILHTLTMFLISNRKYVKARNTKDVFTISLASEPAAQKAACQGLTRLLGAFEVNATSEGKDVSAISALECTQPLAVHLPVVLNILADSSSLTVSSTSSLPHSGSSISSSATYALQIIEHLQRQGLINPNEIIAPLLCASQSFPGKLGLKAFSMLRQITETSCKYLFNNIHEVILASFVNLVNRDMIKYREPIPAIVLETWTVLYSETIRKNSRNGRERFLRVLCQQFETISIIVEKMSSRLNANIQEEKINHEIYDDLPTLNVNQYLGCLLAQYIGSIMSQLPMIYESEALYTLYELNKYLSLGPVGTYAENPEQAYEKLFIVACASIASTSVYKIIQRNYKITDNMLNDYNPDNSVSNEKPRHSWVKEDHEDLTFDSKRFFAQIQVLRNLTTVDQLTEKIQNFSETIRMSTLSLSQTENGRKRGNRKAPKRPKKIFLPEIYTSSTDQTSSESSGSDPQWK